MQSRTLKILVGGLLLAICAAASTAAALPAPLASSPFLLTRWTTESGLPQNTVTSIVQTPDGYLWLGTFGGLARFDGVKFTIFNSGNTPALVSNRITALHVGRDGSLWVGAETGEVTRLRQGRFQFFARVGNSATESQMIWSLYEDRTGSLWVAARGVTRFVAGEATRAETYDERQGLPPTEVKSVCEDREGHLWACAAGGLALFQPAQAGQPAHFTRQFTPTVSDRLMRAFPHSDGGLWLLTETTLFRWQQERLSACLRYSHKSFNVAPVSENEAGDLLFAFNTTRLFQFTHTSGARTEYPLPLGQERGMPQAIYSLHTDREGNIWVGTVGQGLLRLSRRRVTMLQPVRWRADAGGGPVLEDRRGALWFGNGDGLFRAMADTQTSQFTAEQRDWYVGSLLEDQSGDVWFGLMNGIARYHKERFTRYPLPGVGLVQAMCEDRQQQLWLGTPHGLVRWRDGKTFRQADGLVSDDVRFLLEDRAGALWIATPHGLSRFYEGRFTNFTTAQGLSNAYVRAIHEDADGTLWIGTYGGGLHRLRPPDFTHLTPITSRHGLFDDFISRILAGDPKGNDDTFWMLGNRGIFQVSRRALNEVADGHRPSLTCVVYDKADGMDPSEGSGGYQPAGWRAHDGRLFFPTIRGTAVVDPRLADKFAPPVVIERVRLDGVELDARAPLEIPPGKGNLEIEYTGLNLSKPEQVQFSFRLRGLSEDWVEVGRRRTAYFPQLAPGRYGFSVRALSPDGVWSEQTASLSFVVRSPWWRTWWFLVLAVLVGAGLAFAAYRWRVAMYRVRAERQEAFARQLIASQEQERKRLAAELHDGLGQNLLTIRNWARMGLKMLPAEDAAQKFLNEIADTTALTIEDVRQMAQNLRPSQLERLGLTNTLEYMVRNVARASGIAFTTELDNIDGLLPSESEINLFRVVQECANNVVKHSGASRARLVIKRSASGLNLSCEDNGHGFVMTVSERREADGVATPLTENSAPLAKGFGLRWMQERVNLLGGKMTIRSAPGEGTTVLIEIYSGRS